MYVMCMARKISTTVRLDPEDAAALARARKDGHDASGLIRRGLRIVAARYYDGRRPPSTGLFASVDNKLGDEDELFGQLEK
jgi:hypothetical protein